MCGISGYLGFKEYSPTSSQIEKTLQKMKVRGPDGSGIYQERIDEKIYLSLLHSRLSIIDPHPRSNQPLYDDNGVLIFNGMIYNYKEIKQKLKKKNVVFKTESDSEVLLKFLNLFGEKKLNMLDGMWSFAYFNRKNKELILSKDRFGEKPLYYSRNKQNIVFGSNPDYLFYLSKNRFKINFETVEKYLKYGWRSVFNTEDTFFENIYALKPGSYLKINKKFKIEKKDYWNPTNIKIKNNLNYNLEKKKLLKVYKKVLDERTVSDFPIACSLSGGIDSSSIASLAHGYKQKHKRKSKLHCFSIKTLDPNYDESNLILKTVKKAHCRHTFVEFKRDNYANLKLLNTLINKTGCIVPTTTWLIYSKICKEIKKRKYKVILTGHGGDELFAGYYLHHLHYLKSIFNNKSKFSIKFNEWHRYVKPFIRSDQLNDFSKYLLNLKQIDPSNTEFLPMKKYFKKFKKEKVYKEIFFKDFFKNELYKELIHSSLPSQIIATDNISMYHGLENRSPLLSTKLFNLAFSYPGDFLINKGFNKAIFRDSLRGHVDSSILNNREKIGFFTNIDNLFDFNIKKMQKLIFHNKYINSLINIAEIKRLLLKKNKNNQECHLIFAILNCVFFLKKYDIEA